MLKMNNRSSRRRGSERLPIRLHFITRLVHAFFSYASWAIVFYPREPAAFLPSSSSKRVLLSMANAEMISRHEVCAVTRWRIPLPSRGHCWLLQRHLPRPP